MSEALPTIVCAWYLTLWQHTIPAEIGTVPVQELGYCRTALPASVCACGRWNIVMAAEEVEEAE